jgi:hypothetical protein
MPFWRTVTVSFGCHTTHIVNIELTAFEGSVNTFRSQPRWLAHVRFRLPYLGWRSTSLGLGDLTLGSCGNAFGVKKDDFVAQMQTYDSKATYRHSMQKMWVMVSQDSHATVLR